MKEIIKMFSQWQNKKNVKNKIISSAVTLVPQRGLTFSFGNHCMDRRPRHDRLRLCYIS